MSYNITKWKVKELTDLQIPINEFFNHDRTDFHPEKLYDENGVLTLDFDGDNTIVGTVANGIMYVTNIKLSDDFSGYVYTFLINALNHSTGTLTASIIWECGDSISKLEFNDGVIIETDIEL